MITHEITEEQLELLNMGPAFFPNYERYGYYRTAWMKLREGSNIAEMYWKRDEMPKDLLKFLIEDLTGELEELKKIENSCNKT